MSNQIEYIIEPSRGWGRIPWRELVHYSDLLFLLVRRDFISRYKQTMLGPLWFVIQPLLTTVVFTIIFGRVAKISTDELPPVLFYMCGLLAWGYFAQCMGGTSTIFVSNAGLFGKVYFPRLIIPLSVVISNFMSFAIQLVTFLVFWVWFKFFTSAGDLFHFTAYLFALPVLLLLTAGIGLGVGLWMSALTAKYRDFSHLAGFLTQLWMFATPIVYPLSEVPARWQWVSALNPMTGVVEAYRYAFLGAGTIQPLFLSISVATTTFVLITGIILFTKTEKTFIDTV
ncbi:MAG: ABC transporter permease [Kiritimatiellae bacterium]|nr:ABC transporter permease [Kiritimatiellia bacterium]MDD5521881.1 ABC transporter permease [Kiritimatiellia bacterium]